MKKSILLLLLLLIPVLALAQTAEEYFNRGVAKSDGLGDHKGAIQDYNKAIELNPNYALAYGLRGLSKIKLGQKDSGCLDLSKAGELGFMDAYDAIKEYCN